MQIHKLAYKLQVIDFLKQSEYFVLVRMWAGSPMSSHSFNAARRTSMRLYSSPPTSMTRIQRAHHLLYSAILVVTERGTVKTFGVYRTQLSINWGHACLTRNHSINAILGIGIIERAHVIGRIDTTALCTRYNNRKQAHTHASSPPPHPPNPPTHIDVRQCASGFITP